MAFLAALRLAKKHRGKAPYVVILIFLGVLYAQEQKVERLEIALAAKPKVVEKKVEVVVERIKRVQGPERVVERIVREPSGVEVIERTVYKDRVVVEKGTETTARKEREQDPVAAMAALDRPPAKRWLLGFASAPGALDLRLVRGGITLKDRFDLTYAYEMHGPQEDRHRLEFAVRF